MNVGLTLDEIAFAVQFMIPFVGYSRPSEKRMAVLSGYCLTCTVVGHTVNKVSCDAPGQ